MKKFKLTIVSLIVLCTLGILAGCGNIGVGNDDGLDTLLAAAEEFSENGTGDAVITGVVAKNKYTILHFTHNGSRNFIVNADEDSVKNDLLINVIGSYDGYVILSEKGTFRLEIQADGEWAVEIVQFKKSNTDSFSGTGDMVTGVFVANTDAWRFTHNGKRNFIVKQYSVDLMDLSVNKIGEYAGEDVSMIKKGEATFFVVHADGDWTIAPK